MILRVSTCRSLTLRGCIALSRPNHTWDGDFKALSFHKIEEWSQNLKKDENQRYYVKIIFSISTKIHELDDNCRQNRKCHLAGVAYIPDGHRVKSRPNLRRAGLLLQFTLIFCPTRIIANPRKSTYKIQRFPGKLTRTKQVAQRPFCNPRRSPVRVYKCEISRSTARRLIIKAAFWPQKDTPAA